MGLYGFNPPATLFNRPYVKRLTVSYGITEDKNWKEKQLYKQLKRNRALGPDDIPMEFLKELNE